MRRLSSRLKDRSRPQPFSHQIRNALNHSLPIIAAWNLCNRCVPWNLKAVLRLSVKPLLETIQICFLHRMLERLRKPSRWLQDRAINCLTSWTRRTLSLILVSRARTSSHSWHRSRISLYWGQSPILSRRSFMKRPMRGIDTWYATAMSILLRLKLSLSMSSWRRSPMLSLSIADHLNAVPIQKSYL